MQLGFALLSAATRNLLSPKNKTGKICADISGGS
jgi:hypothetical protein